METIQRVAWFSLATITEIQNYNLALLIIDRKLTKKFFWRFFPDMVINLRDLEGRHCAKSVQIRGFPGPYFLVFGLYLDVFTPWIFVFSPNTGKYGPEKTSHLDSFHVVRRIEIYACPLMYFLLKVAACDVPT